MSYKVVRHEALIPSPEGDEIKASFWCIEAPDGQRFTILGVTQAIHPDIAPEVLRDLASGLNAGRALRLGLPIVGLTA